VIGFIAFSSSGRPFFESPENAIANAAFSERSHDGSVSF
jgi:hypothetical protein